MSDDRFQKDSSVYSPVSKEGKEIHEDLAWDAATTPHQYFVKAFEMGKQDHPTVQRMKKYFLAAYKRAEEEWGKEN